MRSPIPMILAAWAASICGIAAAEDHAYADAIYRNGHIWTGNTEHPRVESLAIREGRIVALGTAAELDRWIGDETVLHDLGGNLVTPGFQDSHIHIMYNASPQVDLADAESLKEIQRRILEFSVANPELPWILGFGWGYGAFPDQTPLASYLDEVVASRPAFIRSRDGHMTLVNTRALELASIDESTPDPENGRIVRTQDGRATGELQESAAALVGRLIPPPSEEQRYRALLKNMRRAAAAGITAFHETGVAPENIALFEQAAAEGEILQRVELALRMVTAKERNVAPLRAAKRHVSEGLALRARFDGPYVRVRSIKGMLDGTIDATTAAMFEDYVGTETAGIPFWEVGVLQDVVTVYDKAGFQVVLHAIGDRAISEALDALAHASEVNGTRDARHRIEHAEMPRLSDLERFRMLNVTASTQPMFAYPDTTVLENFAVLLGHDRARYADNFALWDDAGVRQVFGSDYPVMPLSVLKGIEAAVTRMTESGTPPGGWYPEGRIPVEAALRHYTSDAAWGIHDDRERGTLEVGKYADFVVLSQNILEIDPTRISETEVLLTVLQGRVTHAAVP